MESDNKLASEMTSTPVLIGEWTFYADILQLKRGEQQIKLEPRAAYLLYYLAKNAGSPVSRDDLMAAVWPNMVVGDEALTSAINKLRNAFEDDSHHPQVIETIPKVGYRLIANVEFLPSKNNTNNSGENQNTTSVEPTGNRRALIAIFCVLGILLALVITALWFSMDQDDLKSPYSLNDTPVSNKMSIAVLPFENLGAKVDQEYFSDGIAEDIITDLSQLKSLAVIARNSSFTYRGKSVKVQDIGKDLGVKYLLEGSVRRDGNQIRITAQLIDTGSGHHLWAERFDRELTDMFAVQDEITGRIVSALSIQLTGDEQQQLAHIPTDSIEAYDLFLQGRKFGTRYTKDGYSRAAEIYRKVISIDPGYARAYGALGVVLSRQVTGGHSDSPAETKERALELVQKAVSIYPHSPQVQWSLGYIYLYRNQFEEAVEALERAISLSPNYADGYALLALIKNNLGQAEDAIRLIKKGMDLNPHYSWDYLYNLGRAHYALGEYKQATEYLQHALERNEGARAARIFLVASYVQLGQQDEAEWEIMQLEVSDPAWTLSHLKRAWPISDTALMDRLISDLRSAGMAE
jgi:TolB-like protein/DNA-binding winged helix-turn-helix (wHTH) protein/Flp pilus assembly protein TadD